MAIQNTLPDPSNPITPAGDASGTATGPGFASIKLASKMPVMRDKTNGGTTISRYQSYQKWEVQLSYNPLTKEEFDIVYGFLLERQSSLEPFNVALPNYNNQSTDSAVSASATAGTRQLLLTSAGTPSVGDLFHIVDPTDSTHTKAYKIVRVETSSTILTQVGNTAANPTGQEKRITFLPPLRKSVASTADVVLSSPLIQVLTTSDTLDYSLNKDGLYKFSLKLEEACY